MILKIWITLKPMFVSKISEEKLKTWIEKSFINWRVMTEVEFVGKLPKAVLGKVQKRSVHTGGITKAKLNK